MKAITLAPAPSDLSTQSAAELQEAFAPLVTQANDLVASTTSITVTSENDVAGMTRARDAADQLKSVRLAVEKTHKTVKASGLAFCKAVDLAKRSIVDVTTPEEERLRACENFAKLAAQQRRDALHAARVAAITPYTDPLAYPTLGDMTEEAYNQLLSGLQLQAKQAAAEAKKAAKQAEADAKAAAAQAEADAKERQRLATENAKLKAQLASTPAATLPPPPKSGSSKDAHLKFLSKNLHHAFDNSPKPTHPGAKAIHTALSKRFTEMMTWFDSEIAKLS